MATTEDFPYATQNSPEVSSLIKALEAATKANKGKGSKKERGFSCKKASFVIPDAGGLTVDSWRFQDWDYKRNDLPIYARGLFTYKRTDNTPEIAIRGYDKFFNVGEVNETQWRNIENGTRGPYELSVKENGCIIFISGLENDILLVCSKHSTGARQDTDLSHAIAGEKWVDKHLAAIGKTRQDLSRELRRRNATLVAELCDDSFEEHVLEYIEETAGLYIHGINLNLPEFTTYPGQLVHKFADDWGFKKADYLVKDDIETVKAFLDRCAETGSYDGRDTEGFVVRCQKREGGSSGSYTDWFFKYKFEEPYLMYRQWREATKAFIAGKVPQYKKHQKITEDYLLFARRQLAADPRLGKAYNMNHGIIKMRNDFLVYRGLKGSDIIRQEQENKGDGNSSKGVSSNVVLVPIATIGCGKTTMATALTKLFDWGHIQNDNITGQKGRPKQFATQICNSLAEHPVVIADRNNHQRRERKQIIADVSQTVPAARFVALHYVHHPKDQKLPEIRRVTRERVHARGDNHQTIQAGTKSKSEIDGIMEGFLQRFEPLDANTDPDDQFHEIIDLDVIEDSRHNLQRVIDGIYRIYPDLMPGGPPSASDQDDAITAAMNDYAPKIKHDLSFKTRGKRGNGSDTNNWKQPRGKHFQNQNADEESERPRAPDIEYFCLRLPAGHILSALETAFSNQNATVARFYRQLQKSRRIQPSFHVTLIHRASISEHGDMWRRLTALHLDVQENATGDALLGKCLVALDRIVWDNRIMCIVARMLDDEWESANIHPHITIGTADPSVKPKESNDLLHRWSLLGASAEHGISELGIKNSAEVIGEAMAVTRTTR